MHALRSLEKSKLLLSIAIKICKRLIIAKVKRLQKIFSLLIRLDFALLFSPLNINIVADKIIIKSAITDHVHERCEKIDKNSSLRQTNFQSYENSAIK